MMLTVDESTQSIKFINVIKLVTFVTEMMSMLKSGYLKIMALFYENKAARLHLREIARKAKLHEPSTTAFLNALEKDKIIKSEKDGNQKKYVLNFNHKTYEIFQLFDLEKLHSLPSIRRGAINYFLDALDEKPLIAFVFGSTAKGAFNADSDIDMLLITNSEIDSSKAEKNAESLTGIRIGVFQMAFKDFSREIKLKEDPVIQAALSTGYPVLNQLYYYEAIYGHQIS